MTRRLGVVQAIVVLAALALAPHASAAPLVTNTNDSGAGSLRQAIIDAAPGDTIAVPAGTYTLTSGQLDVDKALTLAGAGARTTTISGGGASRVMFTNGAPVRLTGLTITGGKADVAALVDCQGGGGICSFGDLELDGVAVVGNVTNVNFTFNAEGGGGLYNNGDTMTIANSTIAGNQANVTLASSTQIAAGGGGIFNNGSTTTVSNSTISGNTFTVNGMCTVLPDCRHGGGGFYANGNVNNFTNVTMADNSAGGTAPSSGGNFYVDNSPPSVFKNAIVSGGVSPGVANCDKTGTNIATSSGGNLESADTCGFNAASDKRTTNPLLAALANNGGPTDTRALMAGSPAIDAAVDCPSAADQRGVARPVGGACDSGAFEFVPPPPPPPVAPPPPPPPPVDPDAGCVTLTGTLQGNRLGRVRLGETQKRQRAVFKDATRRSRAGIDRYCVRGGSKLAVGYPTAKFLQGLPARLRKLVANRVVLAHSSSKRFAAIGVRAGASLRSVRSKLQRAKQVRIGRRTWYVKRGRSVMQLVVVRGTTVESVGIGDARLGANARVLKRLLTGAEL